MASAELYAWLLASTVATSAAIVLVLALRKPLRASFGPGAAYAAWSIVPAALLSTLLPASQGMAPIEPLVAIQAPIRMLAVDAPAQAAPDLAALACIAWASGGLGFACLLARQQRRFLRGLGRLATLAEGAWRAEAVAGLPAVIGLWSPRIVMPADAWTRYDGDERRLMLAHEREHIARGDLPANALVAVLRCLFWFNPLLHLAARRFRDDQELACDQRVIARHPQSRRAYGEAMLKTQLAGEVLPFGCHWGQSHPLKERIEMLKRPIPSTLRRAAGGTLVATILLAVGYAAWASQPASVTGVPADGIAADIALRVDDGEPVRMRVVAKPGQPFSLTTDGQPRRLELSGTITRVQLEGAPALSLALAIAENGKALAAPKIVVANGKAAGIALGSETRDKAGRVAFKGVRLDVTLTDSTVKPVVAVSLPAPAYPAVALEQGVGGKVVLLVDVAADGRVSKAVVDRSEPVGVFDAAALESVKAWTFEPAMRDGKPVPSRIRVPIEFAPDGQPTQRDRRAMPAPAAAAPVAWNTYAGFGQSLAAAWQPAPPRPKQDDC